MGFERWGYKFEGAWSDPNKLELRSGVYVIWCKLDENWTILDVGESGDVKARVLNHDRSDCWTRNCRGTIYYSVTYTPNQQQAGRKIIETFIREHTNPLCGEI